MQFSFFRKKPKRPDDMLPAGWQFFSRPTNLEPPGTVFRIDSDGRRFIVERLKPDIDRGPEPGAAKQQSIEARLGMLARLLGLKSASVGIGTGTARALQFEITDPVRESTSDAAMDQVLKPFIAAMEFRVNNRYYVIRESRSATAMKFVLSDEQLGQIGGKAAVTAVGASGLTLSAKQTGISDLTQAFPQRLSVMFLPEEITAVRAGLAAGESELGRVPVTTALNWVEPDYAVVRVFFGTDRNLTGSDKPDKKFGIKRSDLSYGSCEISIPRDHRMGELEAPSIWRLEFREDPVRHVVLLDAVSGPKDKIFAELATRVQASAKNSAFIFVHGYNVTFEDAARRTAQMSYDLGFDGAAVFYSWPSQGTVAGYTIDEANIEWAQAHLKSFLRDLLDRSNIDNLYVIAHSMGNRALTRAMATVLVEDPALKQRLTEIILTAPDIDAEVFKQDIAPALTNAGRPVTLYASSEDLALVASKKIHGYPRAGDSGTGLVIAPGIETIDATAADTSLLGHSYFAESRSVLSDIFYLIGSGQRAKERFGLREIDIEAGRYWVFRK